MQKKDKRHQISTRSKIISWYRKIKAFTDLSLINVLITFIRYHFNIKCILILRYFYPVLFLFFYHLHLFFISIIFYLHF